MKIVLAIDSFKDCLSSKEVESAAEDGIRSVVPSAEVISIPISDGGEGLLDSLIALDSDIQRVRINTHDALMRPLIAEYGIKSNYTAIIEMASTCGLALLSVSERNPLNTTSFGLGEMIKDALERGCTNLIIGIGGSATNDAGIGMLKALGFDFVNSYGNHLEGIGSDLNLISRIVLPAHIDTYNNISITIASDVENPLFGHNGAAFVFAAQKGANTQMICELDEGLRHFAKIVSAVTHSNYSVDEGSGAAGGVGFAFKSFFNCNFIPGIEFMLDFAHFDDKIEMADLIITGEGKIDKQTLMGKVPIGVLKRALKKNIPVIAIAGKVEDRTEVLDKGFKDLICINPNKISMQEAINKDYATSRITETVRNLLERMY